MRETSEYARLLYHQRIDSFISSHLPIDQACFDKLKERFTISYALGEDYFTLIYYDQAGNIIQTVSPKGVNQLSTQDFDPSGHWMGQDPGHGMIRKYWYNTYNSETSSLLPDMGLSRRWYNTKGQLIYFQNAEDRFMNSVQAIEYDELGREKLTATINNIIIPRGEVVRDSHPITNRTGSSDFNVSTVSLKVFDRIDYADTLMSVGSYFNGRLVAVRTANRYEQLFSKSANQVNYKYDCQGGLISSRTKIGSFDPKLIEYTYDPYSNNIISIDYQPGQRDNFKTYFLYDLDNRLQAVETSRNDMYRGEVARYFYYPDGNLLRIELGNDKVQAIDYSYTINNRLKYINIPGAQRSYYSHLTTANDLIAKDEYAIGFGYFPGDYKSINPHINTTVADLNWSVFSNLLPPSPGLYDGKISWVVEEFDELKRKFTPKDEIQATIYQYDQAYRLARSSVNRSFLERWHPRTTYAGDGPYDTEYKYDRNGNLIFVKRNIRGPEKTIDKLSYSYFARSNKLSQIMELSNSSSDGQFGDLSNSTLHKFIYNKNGATVSGSFIDSIGYYPNGKIKTLIQDDVVSDYQYDINGDLVLLKVKQIENNKIKPESENVFGFLRDINGNLIAEYSLHNEYLDSNLVDEVTTLQSFSSYGIKRIGKLKVNRELSRERFQYAISSHDSSIVKLNKVNQTFSSYRSLHFNRYKPLLHLYELVDHTGNVNVVLSGLKLGIDSNGDGRADFYKAKVEMVSDSYPFGLKMPFRKFRATRYTWGFQNQFLDKVNEKFAHFKFRSYPICIGRFLSVDPLAKDYPQLSPYSISQNDLVNGIEFEGLEYIEIDNPNIESVNLNGEGAYQVIIDGESYLSPDIYNFNGRSYFNVCTNLYCNSGSVSTSGQSLITQAFVTSDELKMIFPQGNQSVLNTLADNLNENLFSFGVRTTESLSHFLSQAGHETGGFLRASIVENLNYSEKGLLSTWPSRFSKALTSGKLLASDYARKPEKIANAVYANRMGNGPISSGDGWSFRGRGIFQLTGRKNYTSFQNFFNSTSSNKINLLANPDLLSSDSKLSAVSALWFFQNEVMRRIDINTASVRQVTRLVNGPSVHGLSQRKVYYNNATSVLR